METEKENMINEILEKIEELIDFTEGDESCIEFHYELYGFRSLMQKNSIFHKARIEKSTALIDKLFENFEESFKPIVKNLKIDNQ